ncbi:MAG: DNA primase [Roseateles depolymerans]|uniref:DNA primase n=1 Tax=Roseateles depolymerans TaxID=76731 RepID=A0A2W5E313_9BURK|nr:MAG: DNA primase [Roseateles depolymerans]
MIPPGFIHDLLARVDIVDVVGRHVELKKAGINHKGLCPFHGEKSPSFTVSPSRQTYHCFGCGVHGNAIGFLMEHTGAGFIEAVEDLAQQVGMQVPQDERSPEQRERAQAEKARHLSLTDVLARAADHYRAQLKKSPRAIDYLKGRGLTGQIAARFALGYAPEGWRSLASGFPSYDDPQLVDAGLVIDKSAEDEAEPAQDGRPGGRRYDRFRDRVMFPIRNVQGEVIGFGGRVLDKGEPKYLNSPETPVFHKGRELYGLFEARTALRQRGYALVVEGYMDVVALAQHGLGNAVATLGTACTPDHVHKLFRFTENIVFSFDGDAAGRRAAVRALEASLPHVSESRSVKFLFLPTEHDPDSYVRELGAEAFERCVEDAVPLSRQLIAVAGDGCDLSTPEGRARMLKQAQPLWNLLPDGLLRRQLLGELARHGQLPESELQGLWTGASAAAPATRDGDVGPPVSQEARPRKEWRTDRKRGDWKPGDGKFGKWRGREAESRPAGPRIAPATAADNAVRLLLQHSELWDSLAEEDKGLLHDLGGTHGELIRWLERHLTHHGACPWAVVQAGLASDGLADAAQRLSRPHQELGIQETDPQGDLSRAVTELRSRAPEALPGGATASDDERRRALEALARLRERHGIGPS